MRNIGVEMIVKPIVEADDTISLQLGRKFIEFEGFVEYGKCCRIIKYDCKCFILILPADIFYM
jgi:hypothetical protein